MDYEIVEGYNNRLKNKLFGLLCEFEKEGEWESFLESIQLELLGIPVEQRTINYYVLFSNLASLKFVKYQYFRKIIFDSMSLLSKTAITEVENEYKV